MCQGSASIICAIFFNIVVILLAVFLLNVLIFIYLFLILSFFIKTQLYFCQDYSKPGVNVIFYMLSSFINLSNFKK